MCLYVLNMCIYGLQNLYLTWALIELSKARMRLPISP